MKERFERLLDACPLLAILRGITTEEIPAVCDVLHESGIRIMEVPLNSPNALESIKAAVRHCGDRMMIGGGTVLTTADAEGVCEAGGTFVVSPNTSADVIRRTKELGMVSMPGFFTPTEGFAALAAGADYLKLFPACLGPAYIKDLQAVIKASIFAVGGVNADNLPSFLKVCRGAGIGGALYKAGKPLEQIAAAARELVLKIRN